MRNVRYLLSKIVPVPMSSTYGVGMGAEPGTAQRREHATWWQWRDRIYRHRVTSA